MESKQGLVKKLFFLQESKDTQKVEQLPGAD